MTAGTKKPTAAQFFQAVKDGDTDRVVTYARQAPELLTAFDPHYFGAPALNIAVGRGDEKMVDALLTVGADPNLKSDWWAGGFAALHAIPPGKQSELAPRLVAGGAKVDAHAAAWMGDVAALLARVDENPDVVHEKGGDGRRPIHFATTPEVARLLVDRGSDLDSKDVDHESTAAMWAARDYPEVAKTLLEAGAEGDVFLYAAIGEVDALAAVLQDTPGAATWVIDEERFPTTGAHVSVIYRWSLGWNATPLHVAARCNQPGIVRAMVGAGADLAIRGDYDDATPLHIAAWEGAVDSTHALIHAGAPLDAISGSEHENEPLGWAIVSGKVSVAKLLLANGAALRDHHRQQASAGVEGKFTPWSSSTLADWIEIKTMVDERPK